MTQTTAAYIGLGSNMGDMERNLHEARIDLAGIPFIDLGAVSSIYQTEPQGRTDQPWFVNQVMRLDCGPEVDASMLLNFLFRVEARLGRTRDPDDIWGPRLIDLDLLLFGDTVLQTPELTLPHPRLTERAFVLIPLLEIAPQLILPDGSNARQYLNKLSYRLEGRKIYQ